MTSFHFPVEDLSQAFSTFGVRPSPAKSGRKDTASPQGEIASPRNKGGGGVSGAFPGFAFPSQSSFAPGISTPSPSPQHKAPPADAITPERAHRHGMTESYNPFVDVDAKAESVPRHFHFVYRDVELSSPESSPQQSTKEASQGQHTPFNFKYDSGGLFAAGTATTKAVPKAKPKPVMDGDVAMAAAASPRSDPAQTPEPEFSKELVLAAVTAARAAVWASVAASEAKEAAKRASIFSLEAATTYAAALASAAAAESMPSPSPPPSQTPAPAPSAAAPATAWSNSSFSSPQPNRKSAASPFSAYSFGNAATAAAAAAAIDASAASATSTAPPQFDSNGQGGFYKVGQGGFQFVPLDSNGCTPSPSTPLPSSFTAPTPPPQHGTPSFNPLFSLSPNPFSPSPTASANTATNTNTTSASPFTSPFTEPRPPFQSVFSSPGATFPFSPQKNANTSHTTTTHASTSTASSSSSAKASSSKPQEWWEAPAPRHDFVPRESSPPSSLPSSPVPTKPASPPAHTRPAPRAARRAGGPVRTPEGGRKFVRVRRKAPGVNEGGNSGEYGPVPPNEGNNPDSFEAMERVRKEEKKVRKERREKEKAAKKEEKEKGRRDKKERKTKEKSISKAQEWWEAEMSQFNSYFDNNWKPPYSSDDDDDDDTPLSSRNDAAKGSTSFSEAAAAATRARDAATAAAANAERANSESFFQRSAPKSPKAKPRPAETPPDESNLEAWSTRQLLSALRRNGVSSSELAGLVEKADLMARLRGSLAERDAINREQAAEKEEVKRRQAATREAAASAKKAEAKSDAIVEEVAKWAAKRSVLDMLNDILGRKSQDAGFLKRNDELETVAKAYKKALLKVHPDKHMGDQDEHVRATEKFKYLHQKYSEFKEMRAKGGGGAGGHGVPTYSRYGGSNPRGQPRQQQQRGSGGQPRNPYHSNASGAWWQ